MRGRPVARSCFTAFIRICGPSATSIRKRPGSAWIEPIWAEVERDLAYARSQKKPLWVEETAYQLLDGTAEGRKWLMEHESRDELVRFKDEKHEFVFHCVL